MSNIYADAVQVQDACNLSGVLHSWLAALDAIRDEGTTDTVAFRQHPVNVLYADKVYSLTGYGQLFKNAYRIAQDKARNPT